MKKVIFIFSLLLSFSAFSQTSHFERTADVFFKRYVKNGLVDYEKIHQDPSQLQQLVTLVETADTKSMGEMERKAFYINAYNVMVIQLVNENFPTNSPMDIGGFFQTKKITVGKEKYTLNTLENKLLRPTYQDARLHFVLVCGAISCPPITNFAYTGEKLEEQMNQQTQKAMDNPDFIRVNNAEKKIYISEIFKWYGEDFTAEKEDVLTYINHYRTNNIPKNYILTYYPYNWTLNGQQQQQSSSDASIGKSNIQTLTPSSLLKKGQFDFVFFNNIYTQNEYNWDGQDISGPRSNFYGGLIQITYGATKSARVNVGLDINIKSTLNDRDPNGNPLKVLGAAESDSSRTAITSIGPRIKFTPFANVSNFSIQSSFTFPVADHLEGKVDAQGNAELPWLDYNKYIWWNQLFFDKSFYNDKFQIFTELDFLFRFKKSAGQNNTLSTPASVFLSYFPTGKSTVYGMLQHAPTFQLDETADGKTTGDQLGNYSQYGFGAKYQLTNQLNIELLWTDFFRATNGGLGVTYNLGLRYVI